MFTINTARLTLRDLLEADWPDMHALRSDPTVTTYIDYIKSERAEESRQWVYKTMMHNAKEPRASYNLAVIRQSDQQILGWIGIGKASDPTIGDLDFGYALRPAYWRQGYMTEALRALLAFAFGSLNVDRIFGECNVLNVDSAAVMRKVGMKQSALLADVDGETGESCEEFRYVMTRQDFLDQTKQNQKGLS